MEVEAVYVSLYKLSCTFTIVSLQLCFSQFTASEH